MSSPSRSLWIALTSVYSGISGGGVAVVVARANRPSALIVVVVSVGMLGFLLFASSAVIAAASRQTYYGNLPRSPMHYVAIWWPIAILRGRSHRHAEAADGDTPATVEDVAHGGWPAIAARGVALLLLVAAAFFAVVAVVAYTNDLAAVALVLVLVSVALVVVGVLGISNAGRATPSDFSTITTIRKPFPFWLIDRRRERTAGRRNDVPRDS